VSLPSVAEVDHAEWADLVRMCTDLGLNPSGRSGIVRMRVLDHVRRRTRAEVWRPSPESLAALLTRIGFPEEATRLWESAMRLGTPSPWVGYGVARLASGELEEAAKAFGRAAQMGDHVAHLHRAEQLAASGDLVAAVGACDAYLEPHPGDVRATVLKAGFLERGGWLDEAAVVVKAAADAHPDVPELLRALGRIELRAGRHPAAIRALRAATERAEDDVDGWLNRGTAHLLAGQSREAIGAYREALEKDSSRAEGLNNLGVAYLSTGQIKAALVNLQRAAKHLASPVVLMNLAGAEEAAKRRGEAREAVERVLGMRPEEPRALAAKRRLASRRRGAPQRKRPAVAARSRTRTRRRSAKVRRKR